MDSLPEIVFHGAISGVTGSCHELRFAHHGGILIDCGLFQGAEEQNLEIEFPVDHIKALVVTHVHIDHVGRIPYLLAAGFHGPIYCSEASARMLPLVLEDALKIGFTRDRRLIERFLKLISELIVPMTYGRWQTIKSGKQKVRVKLKRAGHILGSAYVECDVLGQRIVFSGDLGAPYAPLLSAPRSPYRADTLILESTYGDKRHSGRRERRQQLRQLIENALINRGVVLIPAFSIGRTQELLYELEDLIYRLRGRPVAAGLPWEELEIIVDSPLADRFTATYKQLKRYWDAEARSHVAGGRHPLSFEQLTTIDSHQEHLQTVDYLQRKAHPCVVIAGSGMCTGGRIQTYLKSLLDDKRTDILFVGYQADGTPGRIIQKYGSRQGYVDIDGHRYRINAGIHTLSGYSAHADQKNLINFVKRMRYRPGVIYLVHGEYRAKIALKNELESMFTGMEVKIPPMGSDVLPR